MLNSSTISLNNVTFFFIRKLLREAHTSAGAFYEPHAQREPMLFMVETPEDLLTSDSAILRSLDEIDGGAAINHIVPFRRGCVYTFFQGGLFFTTFDDLGLPNYV